MLRPLRKTIPAAVAAILVLAACGSDPAPSDAGSVTAESSEASSDGLIAPRPINLSGSGGGAVSAAAESAPSADMAVDSKMMAYQINNFVAGEGLGALPTNDVGYVFQSGATVTPEQVSQLASALGVEGEPERIDDGYSIWWRVGPDDGTAPSVSVYEDAQLSWSYNSAWATQSVSVGGGCSSAGSAGVDTPAVEPAIEPAPAGDVATSEATSETVVPDSKPMPVEPMCDEPAPPAGIITADEAEARTSELMTAVGLDPSLFTFESYGDEWFASASGVEQLDGAFAGRRFDAGFGAEGELQYASGQLAVPARVGPYPLVDLDTAIARLNSQTYGYGGFGGGGIAIDTVARDAGGDVAAVAPDMAEAPVGDVPVDPMPVDTTPIPEPETVTVTLTSVEPDVWWAWDVDGSVWLLPAYRFIGEDGGWYTVPAVTDEFLVQVPSDAVPVPEPAPVETVPAETVPVESVPVDTPPVTTPVTDPALFDSSQLDGAVGSTLDMFTAAAEALGATVRVIEIDGVPQAATMDFLTNRVNVAVTGDPADPTTAVVVAISNVG